MVKENSYISIQAFMVNELHLKGNELLVYAIIWGFSQDGESEFTGSLQYLADWTSSTKQGVMKALQSLCEKQLILKNVEYKNNIRFCTYKSVVCNKVEQGMQQSLMGYTTEFNGGIKQSLPNNINNNINNKLEDTLKNGVPAYIPKITITPKNFQEQMNNVFLMISEYNKDAQKKIPISKNILNFSQKEGRELLKVAQEENADNIEKALKNYLAVAGVNSWKNYFSFSDFCKNYLEYTPEFFDISKYMNTQKNENKYNKKQAETTYKAEDYKEMADDVETLGF